MFKRIQDKSCWVFQNAKQQLPPPPIFLTHCIYMVFLQSPLCASPYVLAAQYVAVIFFITSTHSTKTISHFYGEDAP